VKVYHGLRPNAQGKLAVSIVPDIDFARIHAVEVEQEEPSMMGRRMHIAGRDRSSMNSAS
jgi:hypothetical protein